MPGASDVLNVINRCIIRDVLLSTGVHLIGTPKAILQILESSWFKIYTPDNLRRALAQAAKNIINVHNEFLLFDPLSTENPIKIYERLQENWVQFEDTLYKDLDITLLEDPLGFYVWEALKIQFKGLPEALLKRASVHKFDRDYLINNIFSEGASQKRK